MNILVANLNPGTSSETLLELFLEYGEVSSAKVVADNETGKSKGIGFVEMPNDDEASFAIAQLNQMMFEGNQISVRKTEHHGGADRPGKPGGGFNRGR